MYDDEIRATLEALTAAEREYLEAEQKVLLWQERHRGPVPKELVEHATACHQRTVTLHERALALLRDSSCAAEAS